MEERQGMGRTRVGRFAALAVPATVATAGLAFAMLQGMVGAAISSADGFTLQSAAITSDALKVRPGQADVATTGDDETVYAETGGTTSANGVTVIADVPIPVLGTARLTIDSADPTVALGGVILNAKTLAVADSDAVDGGTSAASLGGVNLGVAQSEAGFTDTIALETDPNYSGYVADGFALTAGNSTLNNLDAQSYAISLASLDLDDLSIGVTMAP